MVEDLVERKLVLREDSRIDRRKIVLTLTAVGQAVLAEARQGTLEQVELLIASLTDQERATVLDAMRLFRQVFTNN